MYDLIKKIIEQNPKSLTHHVIREFLQVHILYNISKSKYSSHLPFLGGTALRILYDTSRYSEDLDFDLWNFDTDKFEFEFFLQKICDYFNKQNLNCNFTSTQNVTVYKSFIKFKGLLYHFGLTSHKQQVLSIKLEIDTNPNTESKIQNSVINKYNLIFPILRRDLSSMMAGKICAIFKRGYHLGRDIYDLGWYLSKKIEPNYEYLQDELKIGNKKELVKKLEELIERIDSDKLINGIRPFLMNKDELFLYFHLKDLIKDYSELG